MNECEFTEREFDEVCEYLVSVGLGYLVADMHAITASTDSASKNLDTASASA